MLKKEKSPGLRVLVVWEPILGSDWGRPTRPALARISDPRVKQFWDKNHVIAKQLDLQLATLQPSCCRHEGTLWDVAALYPKGVQWGGSQPLLIDGPVAKIEMEISRQVSESLR